MKRKYKANKWEKRANLAESANALRGPDVNPEAKEKIWIYLPLRVNACLVAQRKNMGLLTFKRVNACLGSQRT